MTFCACLGVAVNERPRCLLARQFSPTIGAGAGRYLRDGVAVCERLFLVECAGVCNLCWKRSALSTSNCIEWLACGTDSHCDEAAVASGRAIFASTGDYP